MENTVLTSIANQFGSPIYVYDAEKMEHQFKRLTQAFQNVPQLRINYAVKALSNVNILSFMHSLGAGLDTVSIQEVKLGLYAGVPAKMIIFTPNGVSLEEIEEA
ncbi:MAG: diaminopimelate decarboxylase, partial [Flavobacteriaceae bacterium]